MPPPKRSDGCSDVIVNARVTAEERARIRQAAAANLQKPSEFMRDVILSAVSEALEEDVDQAEA